MASVARITDIRGLVSLNDGEEILKEKDPSFYEKIKKMNVEAFVDTMMDLREKIDPFKLLKV